MIPLISFQGTNTEASEGWYMPSQPQQCLRPHKLCLKPESFMPKTTQTLSETWTIYAQDHTNFVGNLNHLCPRPHKLCLKPESFMPKTTQTLSETWILYAQDHTNVVQNLNHQCLRPPQDNQIMSYTNVHFKTLLICKPFLKSNQSLSINKYETKHTYTNIKHPKIF